VSGSAHVLYLSVWTHYIWLFHTWRSTEVKNKEQPHFQLLHTVCPTVCARVMVLYIQLWNKNKHINRIRRKIWKATQVKTAKKESNLTLNILPSLYRPARKQKDTQEQNSETYMKFRFSNNVYSFNTTITNFSNVIPCSLIGNSSRFLRNVATYVQYYVTSHPIRP
jgi:hypothetical protein